MKIGHKSAGFKFIILAGFLKTPVLTRVKTWTIASFLKNCMNT